jgi:hypothetical protein
MLARDPRATPHETPRSSTDRAERPAVQVAMHETSVLQVSIYMLQRSIGGQGRLKPPPSVSQEKDHPHLAQIIRPPIPAKLSTREALAGGTKRRRATYVPHAASHGSKTRLRPLSGLDLDPRSVTCGFAARAGRSCALNPGHEPGCPHVRFARTSGQLPHLMASLCVAIARAGSTCRTARISAQ